MLNGGRTFRGVLYESDYGSTTLITGDIEVAGKVPRVCGRFDGGVSGGTLRGPTWDNSGPSVGSHPPPPYPRSYMIFFPKVSGSIKCPLEVFG